MRKTEPKVNNLQSIDSHKKKNASSYLAWALVLIVLLFVSAVRLRLLQIPLERDEGEFAYMGQLMLQGIPPYELAYNMKLPGIYAAYALIMAIFGQTIAGIHFGLLFINAAAIVLVFLLTKRLFNPLAGVVACASYGILSLSRSVLGTSAHATHFVVLFALLGIMVLLNALESGRKLTFLGSGLLFGTAILMKQPGVFFPVFAVLYLLWSRLKGDAIAWRKIITEMGLLVAGSVIPFLVTCLILFKVGVFKRFWFWTFDYACTYGSMIPLPKLLNILKSVFPHIIYNAWGIWICAGFGIVILIIDRRTRSKAAFLLGFFVFSFFAVCPGFVFRQHYFVMMLPAVAMLAGVGVGLGRQFAAERSKPAVGLVFPILFVFFIVYPIAKNSDFLFRMRPEAACRSMYGINPFPESILAADYIKKHSNKDDIIAVMGSEPQIYFYSGRHSATGYIYTYSIAERQKYAGKMQREMIDEILKSRPKYILYINASTSWLLNKGSNESILKWTVKYIRENYKRVGIVDRLSSKNGSAKYVLKDAADKSKRSESSILIFKRKGSP